MLEEGTRHFTRVMCVDELGKDHAYPEYNIENTQDGTLYTHIKFQTGPVKKVGVNGIFMEDLLQICVHRLSCFQQGNFACSENAKAKEHLEYALAWLNYRTHNRALRNVEGTDKI
jgi:hypothetical protein